LQYYDLLQDVNLRGFTVGASNILFKQKRHLVDVIVEVSDGNIDIQDAELRKQLVLTTADLRFADYLVKCVTEDQGDLYLDHTGWEGGDEWIRGQFRAYLLSLLAVTQQQAEQQKKDFNMDFVSAWSSTNNYKLWASSTHSGLEQVVPCHPFHGNFSVADMKLRLSHSMQSTERGKKINTAVAQTGRVVMQTGRVVGGAFTSAKSAVSSWFSSFGTNEENEDIEDGEEAS